MNQNKTSLLPVGLRALIVWLVAFSFLPVFLYAVLTSVQSEQEQLARTQADLLTTGREISLHGERHFEGTRQLLNALANGSRLKGQKLDQLCLAFLPNTSYYNNVGLLDPAGNLKCSAVASGQRVNISDDVNFKEAVATKSFVIGDYEIGLLTNLPRLSSGLPFYDEAGSLKGVAFAAMDLTKLGLGSYAALQPGFEVTITDRNGITIGTDPARRNRIGEVFSRQILEAVSTKPPLSTFEMTDPQGIEKIYAVTTMGDTPTARGLYVVLSAEKNAVVRPLQLQLAWTLALISSIALAGIAIAWWIATRAIIHPTLNLLDQMTDLAGVNVTLTADEKRRSNNEIVAISDAFNGMKDILTANEGERTRREAELRNAQARLLDAQRIGNMGNWEHDVRADRMWLSDQIYEVYGFDKTAGPYSFKQMLSKVHRDDRREFERAYDFLYKRERLDLEHRIDLGHGEVRWVHSLAEATFDDLGVLLTVSGTARDITREVTTKAELQETQGLLKMASGMSRLGAWRIKLPGRALTWSDEVALIHELPPGSTPDLQGGINYYTPESVPVVERAVEACIQHGTPFDLELQLVTAKSNLLDVRVVGGAVRNQKGEIVRLEGAIQDVTERRAEKIQLELLQTAVARLHDMVLITEAEPLSDPGPRIVFVNDAFVSMTGYTREEVIGKSPRFLQGPATDQVELKRISDSLKRSHAVRSELINYNKKGEPYWIELDIAPIVDATGRPTHMVAVERDITERKKSEQEIMRLYAELEDRVQQRTAELQRVNQELEAFSYSVSHDLRSPLNTMAGFSQILKKSDGASMSVKGKHCLSRIEAGASQMAELIEGLLALAQVSKEKLRYEEVNLSQLARHVEARCRERDPTREVEVLIQDPLEAWGDSRLLLAVLDNLIGNAWKFTSKVPSARIELFSEEMPDGTTSFVVRDNGAGFDSTFSDKLFGAFQRLHSQSEFSGTGVGLTIVKRVIERHGGRVWATSRLGEGSSFKFTLAKAP
jgi:PAS domain S-box-containing protein